MTNGWIRALLENRLLGLLIMKRMDFYWRMWLIIQVGIWQNLSFSLPNMVHIFKLEWQQIEFEPSFYIPGSNLTLVCGRKYWQVLRQSTCRCSAWTSCSLFLNKKIYFMFKKKFLLWFETFYDLKLRKVLLKRLMGSWHCNGSSQHTPAFSDKKPNNEFKNNKNKSDLKNDFLMPFSLIFWNKKNRISCKK